LKSAILNIRNSFDFFLRRKIHFSRALPPDVVIPRRDLNLQIEFQEFLQLFDWKPLLAEFKNEQGDSCAR